MRKIAQQQGMTAVGILLIVAIIGFFIFILFKAAPVYIESYNADHALNSLHDDFAIAEKSVVEIRSLLGKRFELNDIRNIRLKEDVSIKKQGKTVNVTAAYEVDVLLFGNVYLLFIFDKQVVLK